MHKLFSSITSGTSQRKQLVKSTKSFLLSSIKRYVLRLKFTFYDNFFFFFKSKYVQSSTQRYLAEDFLAVTEYNISLWIYRLQKLTFNPLHFFSAVLNSPVHKEHYLSEATAEDLNSHFHSGLLPRNRSRGIPPICIYAHMLSSGDNSNKVMF